MLNGRDAVVILPPAHITNEQEDSRLYIIDSRTMRPKFSPYVWRAQWTSNGYALNTRRADSLHVYGDGAGSSALARYAPHWLQRQRSQPVVDTAKEALRFVASAITPVADGVLHMSVEEQVRKWMKTADFTDLPATLYLPFVSAPTNCGEDQCESYRIRAETKGTVIDVNPTYLNLRYANQRKVSVRRPRGMPYAVSPGQQVTAGQLLFDVAGTDPNSPAYRALKRVWHRRMFVRMGARECVRLAFVTRIYPCCPMCFTVFDRGYCAGCSARSGEVVRAQTAVSELWLQPVRGSVNYTGSPAEISTVVPPVESLPAVADRLRRVKSSRKHTPDPELEACERRAAAFD
jgi:hypothetical protein